MLRHESLKPNPFGIQPSGNALLHSNSSISNIGFFSNLHESLLFIILSSFDHSDLIKLSKTCSWCYVLCNIDSLWRNLCLSRFHGDWHIFRNSWKNTFKARFLTCNKCAFLNDSCNSCKYQLFIPDIPITYKFYSDYLYSSWRCSSIPIQILCRASIDKNIDRVANLSVDDFVKSIPNKPVIITDVVSAWEAYKKWTREYLLESIGNHEFEAENVKVTYKTYAEYSRICSDQGGTFEESPLYLFDKNFGDTILSSDYTTPKYFTEDLFQLLGFSNLIVGAGRPDFRWLIIGPARSGSTFHVDPNSTSAWNAVISGAKKWILFPPHITPPGVFPSCDGSEVVSPVSLAEWYINHYHEIKNIEHVECVCNAGEIIFVPRGWWHCVINLEETVAITQNFVSQENLGHVLKFLQKKRDQVSGLPTNAGSQTVTCENIYSVFKTCLEEAGVVVPPEKTNSLARLFSSAFEE